MSKITDHILQCTDKLQIYPEVTAGNHGFQNRKMGVYIIKNLINGKSYIGSSQNIKNRWAQHKSSLRHNKSTNIILQQAWNKYGEENFTFELVEDIKNIDIIFEKEQNWIDKYKPEYNISPTAGSPRGYKHTEKALQCLKARHPTLEWRQEHSIRMTGKMNPMWGRKRPDLSKRNANTHLFGEKNHFWGKQHTEETKMKISKANKGHLAPNKNIPHTEETKQKISKANQGKSAPNKGMPHSLTTRRKISEAIKRSWKLRNEEKYNANPTY